MQEHFQDLVLLRHVAGVELSRERGVFGQRPAVAEALRRFVGLPALKQVDDVNVNAGQGLCTHKVNKIVISNQSREMTHLSALADGGKRIVDADLLAHGLPGRKAIDAASNEALVLALHAKVPILLPGLRATAPIPNLA